MVRSLSTFQIFWSSQVDGTYSLASG